MGRFDWRAAVCDHFFYANITIIANQLKRFTANTRHDSLAVTASETRGNGHGFALPPAVDRSLSQNITVATKRRPLADDQRISGSVARNSHDSFVFDFEAEPIKCDDL